MGSIRTIADGNRTYVIFENYSNEEVNRFICKLYSDDTPKMESSDRLIPTKAEIPELPKKVAEEISRPDYKVAPATFKEFCERVMFFINNIARQTEDPEYYNGLKISLNNMFTQYRDVDVNAIGYNTARGILKQALESFSKQDLPTVFNETQTTDIGSALDNGEKIAWLWQYVFRQRNCLA